MKYHSTGAAQLFVHVAEHEHSKFELQIEERWHVFTKNMITNDVIINIYEATYCTRSSCASDLACCHSEKPTAYNIFESESMLHCYPQSNSTADISVHWPYKKMDDASALPPTA